MAKSARPDYFRDSQVVTIIDARVPIGSTERRAWIVRPNGRALSFGVVFVPGSGRHSRNSQLPIARAMAAHGVTVMVYDKRTDGYSIRSHDYARLADDAVAAARVLMRELGADNAVVGIAGFSEGGWITPLALQNPAGLFSFAVFVSAPVVPPLEQVGWALDGRLRWAPRRLRSAVASALAAGARLTDYSDFDVRPALERIEVPVLAVWGERDRSLPVHKAVRMLREACHGPTTVRVLGDAAHRFTARSRSSLREVSEWILNLPGIVGDDTSP